MTTIRIRISHVAAQVLGFFALFAFSAQASDMETSRSRLKRVVNAFSEGHLWSPTRDSSMSTARLQTASITYKTDFGFVRTMITPETIEMYSSRSFDKEAIGPARQGPFPFSEPSKVVQKWRSALTAIFPNANFDTSLFEVRPDKPSRINLVRYGRILLYFRKRFGGHPFVDRLVGAELGVDIKTGNWLTYSDREACPTVEVSQPAISQTQARQLAIQELKCTNQSELNYIGLGYASSRGATAKLCYGYRWRGRDTSTGLAFETSTYILASNGVPLKTIPRS